MAAEKQFRTVIGVVQFEPKEATAGGKPVRNIVVRNAGFGPTAVRVSATVWPSHSHIEIEEGDVVVLDGAYTKNKTVGDDGEERVYHNLSVNKIAVIGKVDPGKKVDVENASSDDDEDDDDIPF